MEPSPDFAAVAAAAQLACLLEASAPKPGNVSPGRRFADMGFEHFLASAAAIGAPLAEAGSRSLGSTIRRAVEATRGWTKVNTNLGIVLLLTPIAYAVPGSGFRVPGSSVPGSHVPVPSSKERATAERALREALRRVLHETTVEDAREVYAAIRIAAPGGLGRVEQQDVGSEPDVPLLEAMRLASDRDGIAREYATAFQTTFDVGVPALRRARADGLVWDDAVVETFLTLLAAAPDTHIVRRGGEGLARQASEGAQRTLEAGGVRTDEGCRAIAALDAAFRDPANLSNPGTSADLTAAAIFVVLLTGGWTEHCAPLPGGR